MNSKFQIQNFFNFSLFGLVLVIDQLLVPMLHFKGAPFKVSYFLTGIWFIIFLFKTKTNIILDRDFKAFALMMSGIIFCGALGELYFSLFWTVDDFEPFFRSFLIYVLIIFSFGLGLSAVNFKIVWLVYVLFSSVFMNLTFIIFKQNTPGLLANFYYDSAVINNFVIYGVTSAGDILNFHRPRGIFANPNASALMVNILSLFIYIALKKRVYLVHYTIVHFLIIILPIIISLLLASRGEFLVSVVLGFLHFWSALKSTPRAGIKLFFMFLLGLSLLLLIMKNDFGRFQHNIDRALSVSNTIEQSTAVENDKKALDGLMRPFLTLDKAYERFKVSPIFGSGFSRVSGHEYFDIGTDYFHNDWFRIIVSTGLIGFGLMLWILKRFVLFLTWPVFIPFLLPGMVNTFFLNIPVVIFFFFMVGFFNSKIKNKE